jgi:uncharacterized protein YqgC (DUF456 family)
MEAAPFLWLLAIVLIAVGLAGVVLPVIPGAPLLFVGLVIAAWADSFHYVGLWTLVALGILAALTYCVDFWATMFGVKRFGASKRAVIGAVMGSMIGVFLGIPGVLFGPFVGAVIGEVSARRGIHAATRAGLGATIGLVLGAALKLALAFTMIGVFVVARYF